MNTSERPGMSPVTRRRVAGVMILGIVSALALVGVGLRSRSRPSGGLQGQRLAPMTLPVITLEPQQKPDQLRFPLANGRPLLLHFWGPSCASCLRETPVIDELYRRSVEGIGGWDVVTVSGEESADLRAWFMKHPQTFPVLLDADGDAHEAYKVFSIPASFVLTPDGTIHRELMGVQTVETFVQSLREAAEVSPVKGP